MGGELAGRTALVTGGTRGIGRAIGVALARSGCRVALNYRAREADAREAVAAVSALGAPAIAVRADVSDPAEVRGLARAVEEGLGPVDVLVSNAGVSRPRALDELTTADFDEAVATNLRAAFLMTQAVLPGMRARGWGRLVYVSSVAAAVGGVVGPHYAASKAGLHGLAHAYAGLLAREGITANVVAPALIDTEMVRDNPRARPDLIPVGRFGSPEEAAAMVAAVASNAYVTGQTFHVNGGWYFS